MTRRAKTYGSAVLAVSILGLLILGLGPYELSYLTAAAVGHVRLMASRQPIEAVLDSPDASPETREKLGLVLRAQRFATEALGLPDNGSYTQYVEIDREQVAWNVYAAPRFSIKPIEWCFPVAGCVVYRGYFSKDDAREFASQQRMAGNDVYVSRVTAYSTLGWFDDPVLSTFLKRSDEGLAGLIFHELAHQRVYVGGDSAFNEGFAVAVEREGVRRWLRSEGRGESLEGVEKRWDETDQRGRLIEEAREALSRLFSSDAGPVEKQRRKDEVFGRLRDALCEAAPGCDQASPARAAPDEFGQINNAYLAAVATYNDYVLAFEGLLERAEGELDRFYREVADAAEVSPGERARRIEVWTR